MASQTIIRKPAVAGQFYPANKNKLEETISSLIAVSADKTVTKNRVKGIVLPHAGYVYSGSVAAATVNSSELKNTFIILGPNHTGLGEPFSVMTEGRWQTPLGEVEIDAQLALKMVEESPYLRSDTLAHASEHSIEVLLPFLQYAKKEIKFVPIIIAQAELKVYEAIARDIVRAINALRKSGNIVLVASSDMTHYESRESAQKKDNYAIEAIINLDTESLLKRVKERGITMCGVAPVAIMLEAAKSLGAKEAKLVKYQTSGDVTGDYSSVVGYAGIRVS